MAEREKRAKVAATGEGKPTLDTAAAECGPEEALSCLLQVAQQLNAADDLAAGLERVAEALRSFVQYDSLAILLLDELGHELRFALAVGFPPEVTQHWRFGSGQGLVGTVAQTGRPLRVDDTRRDSRYIDAGNRARSELAIPLVTKGHTIGVLDLGSRRPGHFGEEHERLLVSLSGYLASAIESARLYQNTRDQARTLSVLHEVSRELNSILDRRELLETVAKSVRRLIDYDLFAVLLWDQERELLVPWLSVFRDGRVFPWTSGIPLGAGICGTAAALRQPLRVPNVHLDPHYVDCETGVQVRSELAIPLLFEGRLLGVLDLESSRFDAFTPRHEQLLSTLASSLAIALENAYLYGKVKENERRIEEDLAMAREIQRQLLPKATPWIPGVQIGVAFEAARELAGDFYDFFSIPQCGVAVAVGDVAGKGTPAALYGSLANGMLREYVFHPRCRPRRVLADLNGKLHRLEIPSRFLAMAFGLYDPDERTLRLANSGLPYPFHLRRGEVLDITASGVPLGLLPDQRYEETVVEVEPGDAVVICSDGVEESMDHRDEPLDRHRVAAALKRLDGASAGEIAQALLEEARRWAGAAEPSDDRTVVVLKAATA